MDKPPFSILEQTSVKVIEFVLPSTIDGLEVDKIITAVLADLDKGAGGKWVVDLVQVQYMGSAMLGMLINIRERIRLAGGVLVLAGVSGPLLRIFQTAALDRLFTIARDRDQAMARIKRL